MQPHAYNLQKRLQSLLTPHNLQLKLGWSIFSSISITPKLIRFFVCAKQLALSIMWTKQNQQ